MSRIFLKRENVKYAIKLYAKDQLDLKKKRNQLNTLNSYFDAFGPINK